jgi:hypothetical protein
MRIANHLAVRGGAAEPPRVAWHPPRFTEEAEALGQHGIGALAVERRVIAEPGPIRRQQIERGARIRGNEPVADGAGDRSSAIGRDRGVKTRPIAGHPGLPPDGDERIAFPHQELVTELGRPIGAVERPQQHAVPPVEHVEQQHAIALRRVLRLDHRDVGAELDAPGRIARRLVEVGDQPVVGIPWIDGEVGDPDELFVRARGTEGLAAEHVGPRLDFDSRELGAQCRRDAQQQHDRKREASGENAARVHDRPPGKNVTGGADSTPEANR